MKALAVSVATVGMVACDDALLSGIRAFRSLGGDDSLHVRRAGGDGGGIDRKRAAWRDLRDSGRRNRWHDERRGDSEVQNQRAYHDAGDHADREGVATSSARGKRFPWATQASSCWGRRRCSEFLPRSGSPRSASSSSASCSTRRSSDGTRSAIGGNREAVRLAGINVFKTQFSIFLMQGLVAGFAGVMVASKMTSGQPKPPEGFALDVISACVLGGVSLSGGVGTMTGHDRGRADHGHGRQRDELAQHRHVLSIRRARIDIARGRAVRPIRPIQESEERQTRC